MIDDGSDSDTENNIDSNNGNTSNSKKSLKGGKNPEEGERVVRHQKKWAHKIKYRKSNTRKKLRSNINLNIKKSKNQN